MNLLISKWSAYYEVKKMRVLKKIGKAMAVLFLVLILGLAALDDRYVVCL